jgi:hypothetical protein
MTHAFLKSCWLASIGGAAVLLSAYANTPAEAVVKTYWAVITGDGDVARASINGIKVKTDLAPGFYEVDFPGIVYKQSRFRPRWALLVTTRRRTDLSSSPMGTPPQKLTW